MLSALLNGDPAIFANFPLLGSNQQAVTGPENLGMATVTVRFVGMKMTANEPSETQEQVA